MRQAIDQKLGSWNLTLSEHESKVEALKQTLQTQQYGFNFVGLYSGFAEMASQVGNELEVQRGRLRIFGLLVLLPTLSNIGMFVADGDTVAQLTTARLLAWLTLSVTLTLVFLYFFRIVLRDVDSKNAQLMQLRLRMTLCQFVQSYADYAVELRKSGPEILNKFENIIFSGIVGDQEKLPSSFDGLEQLSGFIKAVRTG